MECGTEWDPSFHTDHIVPWCEIKKRIAHGFGILVHHPTNLRWLCADCNVAKGAKKPSPDERPPDLNRLIRQIHTGDFITPQLTLL